MSHDRETAALIGGVALLERAITYALGSLHLVTVEVLARPTPCRDWDVRALLDHLGDSLLALHQAIDRGWVGTDPPPGEDGEPDPAAIVRNRARRLLGACTNAGGGRQLVCVAGSPLTASIVASAGAIEIAVHGWDLAQACGPGRPIPPALAEELLDLSPLLVTEADRPGRFAAPVAVPPATAPGDRLVAFLGRYPCSPVTPSR